MEKIKINTQQKGFALKFKVQYKLFNVNNLLSMLQELEKSFFNLIQNFGPFFGVSLENVL